jgi:hypothetical protein
VRCTPLLLVLAFKQAIEASIRKSPPTHSPASPLASPGPGWTLRADDGRTHDCAGKAFGRGLAKVEGSLLLEMPVEKSVGETNTIFRLKICILNREGSWCEESQLLADLGRGQTKRAADRSK